MKANAALVLGLLLLSATIARADTSDLEYETDFDVFDEASALTPAPAPQPTPASPPPPNPPPPPPPPPPCNGGVPPRCRMFVEDALCCEDGTLNGNRPFVTLDVFCSESTAISAACLRVEGPSNVTIVDSMVPFPSYGETFRFTASWLHDLDFNGTVTAWVDNELPFCKLEVDACSVGADNYYNITEPVNSIAVNVPTREDFGELVPHEAATASRWLLYPDGTMAWPDGDSCTMTSRSLIPQAFYAEAHFLFFNDGYMSQCVSNSTQVVPLDAFSAESD